MDIDLMPLGCLSGCRLADIFGLNVNRKKQQRKTENNWQARPQKDGVYAECFKTPSSYNCKTS